MNGYATDKRTVMTLDAGGTNFVFSAVKSFEQIVTPVRSSSHGDNLQKSLDALVNGFSKVLNQLDEAPVAISFSFPGPSDYPNGIIGDLVNLPSYRGGIAIGPMLQEKFKLPVFINNDGDLFTYGEAIAGLTPFVNLELEKAKSLKRYRTLLGITLGTGFGAGIVRNGDLFIGDNAAAAEIWPFPNKIHPTMSAEESVSIRGVRRSYAKYSGIPLEDVPSPKNIFYIATGKNKGDREAALETYKKLGEAIGNALAYAASIIDGLIVIGGGLSGAQSLIMPTIVEEMNKQIETFEGGKLNRIESRAFNLEDKNEFKEFLKGKATQIVVPGTNKKVHYDPLKRIGVGISKLGTSSAISIGAYAYALHELDNRQSQ